MRVAHMVATRSLCVRDQVGAVIVDTQLRITATGRNGPPAGFNHQEQTCITWCARTKAFSWQATGARTLYATDDLLFENGKTFLVRHGSGAVITELKTDEDWIKNGFEKTFTGAKDYSDCPSLHAEVNALLSSDRTRHEGGTIYVTSPPCWSCGKMIANSGLTTLVVEHDDLKFSERNANDTYLFMESVGITIVTLETKG